MFGFNKELLALVNDKAAQERAKKMLDATLKSIATTEKNVLELIKRVDALAIEIGKIKEV